jgi:hypothetical protein
MKSQPFGADWHRIEGRNARSTFPILKKVEIFRFQKQIGRNLFGHNHSFDPKNGVT